MKRLLTLLFLVVAATATGWAKPPQLACEDLFKEDVTKYKNASVSINRSPESYFRQFKVESNAQLVKTMKKLLETDSKLAFSVAEQRESNGSYQKILSIPHESSIINIGFFQDSECDAYIFITGPPAAFE